MSPVKRLLLTADTVGGVWTYAVELSRGLSAHGVRVTLATMGAPLSRGQRREVESIRGLAIAESCYKLEWMNHPWDDIAKASRWLLELESSTAPDVVHLNQYCFGALPFHSPVLVAGHSCVCSWWRAVKGEEAPPDWNRYRAEVARGLAGATLVVAPSRAMLGALREHYGEPARSEVIYNGRSAAGARGGAGSLLTRQAYVFSSGRLWDQAKNMAALEKAAERIPWPVYVAGETRHPDDPTPGSPASRCRLLGKIDSSQMAYWMGNAAVYALPALYEPFGLSVLEAALAGCALVLGDIPSLRELWNGAAVFVSPRDEGAIAGAIRRLIDDPGWRILMGAKARRRAAGHSATKMVENYLSAYGVLAGSCRRRSPAASV